MTAPERAQVPDGLEAVLLDHVAYHEDEDTLTPAVTAVRAWLAAHDEARDAKRDDGLAAAIEALRDEVARGWFGDQRREELIDALDLILADRSTAHRASPADQDRDAQRQTVTVTRLADRHADLHDRDFAESEKVDVPAGDLAAVLHGVAASAPHLPVGRYSLVISEPWDLAPAGQDTDSGETSRG